MYNEINNKVTIASLDKIIYHAIYEIRHRLSKHPDKKRIFQRANHVEWRSIPRGCYVNTSKTKF